MGPLNYNVQVAQPFAAGLQGFQAVNEVLDQQQARELALQQQQAARLAAQRQQEAIASYFSKPNPTARDYAQVLAVAPQLREQLKAGWDAMNTEQQNNEFSYNASLASALRSDRPDVAASMVNERAVALRNSRNEQGAREAEAFAKLIEQDPEYARLLTVGRLFAVDEKRANGLFGNQRSEELQPAAVKKAGADADRATSDAQTAAVTAKYADSAAVLDLQKKGWDLKALEADIDFKRQSTKIAALNAQISRETNELRRQELQVKLDEAKESRETKAREKEANFTSAVTQMDDALQLVDEIRGDRSGLWWATGATADSARIPGSDARTVAGKVEQLQNALAASNLDKLKGAMSDKDIAFLKNIATNLDLRQGTKAVEAELAKIEAALDRGRRDTAQRFGAPVPERRRLTPRGADRTAPVASRSPEEAAAPVQIASDADYNALPSGATFVAPDGTVRRKP